jgi:hypothetical protein
MNGRDHSVHPDPVTSGNPLRTCRGRPTVLAMRTTTGFRAAGTRPQAAVVVPFTGVDR